MMNELKKQRGITLIALVVTIIVLLILAGVSISTLVGDNGLLTKTIYAKKKYEEAAKAEELQLEILNAQIGESSNGNISSATQVVGKMIESALANGSDLDDVIDDLNEKLETIQENVKIRKITNEAELRAVGTNEDNPLNDAVYIVANDITLTSSWTPIGTKTEYFSSIFLGNGKTISGISMDNTSDEYIGLFGYNSGKITNLTVTGTITTTQKGAGGVAGYNLGTIDNCTNEVNITSTMPIEDAKTCSVGGIVGDNGIIGNENVRSIVGGTITNCTNNGTIIAQDDGVGGICGTSYNGNIENCINNGDVSSTTFCVAGICGAFTGATIKGCKNTATISATEGLLGGIVGQCIRGNEILVAERATIIDCHNEGNIVSTGGTAGRWSPTGGIVGRCDGYIQKCSNKGEITFDGNYTGGICGVNLGTISMCFNTKDIKYEGGQSSTGRLVGGIAGQTYHVIERTSGNLIADCYNIGDITGSVDIGGIAGRAETDAKIQRCYNVGLITASAASTSQGGIVGTFKSDDVVVENTCYYIDTNSSGVGRGYGDSGAFTITNDSSISKTSAEMQSDILSGLGANFKENTQTIDGHNYPILTWQ